LISETSEDVLLLADRRLASGVSDRARGRLASLLEAAGAGLVYADSDRSERTAYLRGSIRDDFDFGPLLAFSVPRARQALEAAGGECDRRWGALYDLRLRLSEAAPVLRVPEPLYVEEDPDSRSSGERQFDYVDPRQRDYQAEMEAIATAHLDRIGARLTPRTARVSGETPGFPVAASVVIPVRNRAKTIGEAIRSVLAQEAEFDFNVIVVDNHSTDGTGDVIEGIRDPRVVRIVPKETHLGIGGCWNEAVFSAACGRVAVQLDSDDLYADRHVLALLVGEMRKHGFAMLVGAYTTVDFDLNEVAPGLVDHREWTGENGHNNVLRINGFGAPRVFDVGVLRGFGFPNVSYGEDYAVGLRISREYQVGRNFDSVYRCRRWEGNTDSRLPPATLNRFNSYKDWVRTMEIEARIRMNAPEDGARAREGEKRG
jgi:hypothetical protein